MKPKPKLFWIIILILMVIPTFIKIVRPGFFPMQDLMQVFRSQQMSECLKDFQIPCRWVPDAGFGYGYPQFNFYAPLAYYLTQPFILLGMQIVDALKIVIVASFLIGTFGMFLLAAEFFGVTGGVVSAVLFTYLPYRAQEVYVRWDISEFLALSLFPVIFWSVYKLIKTEYKKYLVLTSFLVSALFLSHVLFSLLFIPLLVLWVVVWIWYEKKIKFSLNVILSIILGFCMSAFFTLPMLFEKRYVHIETLLGGYFDYRQHFVTFKQLFFSNNWGYGSSMLGPIDDLALSTGILQWILGVGAGVIALVNFKRNRKLSLIIFLFLIINIFLLFLTHQKSSFIWSQLPVLAFLQFPWRLLGFTGFIFSFLAGYAVYKLKKYNQIGVFVIIFLTLIFSVNFFTPKSWLPISDKYYLTGEMWENALTASIFDYLPIYAKLPPESKAPTLPEIVNGSVYISDYKKGTNWQSGKIEVNSDAVIRLPLFDFPGMTVYLNNNKNPHVNNNCKGEPFCMGLITFNAPKGIYDFKVQLQNTPVRTAGNIISLISLLVILLLRSMEQWSLFTRKYE